MTSDARSEAPDPTTFDLPTVTIPSPDALPPYQDNRGNSWEFAILVEGGKVLCGWHAETGAFEAFVDTEVLGWAMREFVQRVIRPAE